MADKRLDGDVEVNFTEAQSRQSLESGESVKTLFGKLRKWLSDLKPVAFSGSYNDLTDKTMTGYTKPASTSAITASDTINEAIGKLEAAIDAGGETIPPIVINRLSNTSTSSSSESGNKTFIKFDPNLITTHPIAFKIRGGSIYKSSSDNKYYAGTMQELYVKMGEHGYKLNEMSGNNELSYSSERYYAQVGAFISGSPANNDQTFTRNPNTLIMQLGQKPNNGYVSCTNNEFGFYMQYYSGSAGNMTFYQTYIDYIEPIDFTAVTSVTHGGVTVWERT